MLRRKTGPMKKSPCRMGNGIIRLTLCSILFFLVCVLFLPAPSPAHPPSDLTVNYDTATGTLTVILSHAVSNPAGHFISEVTIARNGSELGTFTYESQPKPSSFSYTYEIEAGKGDELGVTARCNRFGSRSRSITVP